MSEKSKLFFNGKKKVIGMVHLLPLPGNAAYQNNKEEIVKNAIEDAHTLIDCGVDAIMLENFSDWPQYSTEIPLEAYSLMVSIATRIREFLKEESHFAKIVDVAGARVLQDPVRRQHRDERLRAGVGHGLRRRRRLHPL